MKKIRNITFFFLLSIILIGCECEVCSSNYYQEYNHFGFETSEIVIDVTPEIGSYRIVMNCTTENDNYPYPSIEIDRDGTTAKHNVHFVNTPEGYDYQYIGEFTSLGGNKVYKDVEIIPENITEKVVIVYTTPTVNYYGDTEGEPEGFIKELTVILQPKVSN